MRIELKKLALCLLILSLLAGCGKQETPTMFSDSLTGPFDTISTVTIYKTPDAQVIEDVFAALKDMDSCMSAISQSSELAKISANPNEPVSVSEDIYRLIKLSIDVNKETGGAFDITIRPIMELWGFGSDNQRVPTEEEIQAALTLTGMDKIKLSADSKVELTKENMALDLGGIAKGYACDRAVEILRAEGVEHAVVDLGGNVFVLGTKLSGEPWRVGVRTPLAGENGHFGALLLTDKAVVTSGLYERFFEQDGLVYHHIIDPATGKPASGELLSTTIIADSATEADALSTACFVLGLEEGRDLLAEREGVEGIFVTNNWQVYITPGLESIFTLVDDRFTQEN